MKYISLLLVSLLFFSCNRKGADGTEERYLPPSSGTHAEMLLVVHDSLWNTRLAESMLEVLAREQYGLPQPEGVFSLNRIKPAALSNLFRKTKSIVLVEIADTTAIRFKHDVWARPQLVAMLTAPSSKALEVLIRKNEELLVNRFREADMALIRGNPGKKYKKMPKNLVDFGIERMTLSSGFEQTLDKPNLKIFRQSTRKTEQFIVFSKRPMRDDVLPGQDVIAVRDSIGKNYFEGAHKGSYFGTEMIYPPQQNTTEVGGQFALETRGLWRTYGGDIMGGPFLSFTIYNDRSNEVICVEAILYGPDAKKRNILLEMEAMMRSIVFKK